MDEAWIKNLARAKVENGKLVVPLGDGYGSFIEQRIRESMQQVYDLAHGYAAIYNLHVGEGKTINCLPASPEGDRGEGILLLLGRHQIRLAPARGVFLAEGSSVEAFVRKNAFRWVFRPHTDACGSVVWAQDQHLLMDAEMLVKKLFETLVQWEGSAAKQYARGSQVKESFHEN